MLNLLCIPFLLLLTHPQALSLRLQPELLGRNTLGAKTSCWPGHLIPILTPLLAHVLYYTAKSYILYECTITDTTYLVLQLNALLGAYW